MGKKKENYIVTTEHGSFCSVCQSLLSMEEEDFGVCDACDGEGIGYEDEEECEFNPATKCDRLGPYDDWTATLAMICER